jgi:hypothetical protein
MVVEEMKERNPLRRGVSEGLFLRRRDHVFR